MDHTAGVCDRVRVIPVHSHPDDVWKSVYDLRCQMARVDERLLAVEERLLAIEEWHYRCHQLDEELCRAAQPRRRPLPADPDLSDRR